MEALNHGLFYASGRLADNHLQRFHLKPHSNMNTACQRLRFTFNRSLLIRTTCPLYCNVSSYTRSLLQLIKCLFSLLQICCSLRMWRFFMRASHSSYQVCKLRDCPHLSSSARSSFTTLITSRFALLIALIASTAVFFPLPPVPFMYAKQLDLTLDRPTSMYATGRPSDVHFVRTRKPSFIKKRGASAASNVAQVSLYPPNNLSTHICSPFMCDDGA